MKPGMTMQPETSMTFASGASMRGGDGGDPVVLHEDVRAEEVADSRIHAEHMAATEQNALGHDVSLPDRTLPSMVTERLSRDSYHLAAAGASNGLKTRCGKGTAGAQLVD